ncbi:MAG: hypothetical protein RL514_3497 [Verrucomicrobiota bacterium]|jgi:antitoxin (DNA-binding transcriptional repressor) of toxin-antitoxin stability system
MQATLTEAHRDTRRVFRAAAMGRTVRVTEHGKPLVTIRADAPVVKMSAAEFRALELSDAELNDGINQAIAEARE